MVYEIYVITEQIPGLLSVLSNSFLPLADRHDPMVEEV